MEHVYTSIDIGSDAIKVVVCELTKNRLNLLATTSTKAMGIKRGLIVDPKKASASISKAFAEIEDMLGIEIKKVIASVPTYFAEYTVVNSQVPINGEMVTAKDIMEAYRKGIRKNLLPDHEFVNMLPIDFKVDGNIVEDPKGKSGKTLDTRAIMVTVPKKNVYSVASILEGLGIELVDIATGSITDLIAYKNSKLNNIGMVINMGAETTSISLYNRSLAINSRVIDMGGFDIDKEIAYKFKVNLDEAKRIKERFALAYSHNADVNNLYEIITDDKRKIRISQLEVSRLVENELTELLEIVKEEMSNLTNKPLQYIIITGGLSNLENIEYLCHKVLGDKVSIGKIKLIGARDNKYSTAIGNIIYFIGNLKLKSHEYTMISRDDMEVLSTPNKHLVSTSNDTMLGKVFGYFFGE